MSSGLYYFSPGMALFNMARRGAGTGILRNLYLSLFSAFHYSYAGHGRMCCFAALILYRGLGCLRPIISRRGISFSPLDVSMAGPAEGLMKVQ
jgi:hypothetical protein